MKKTIGHSCSLVLCTLLGLASVKAQNSSVAGESPRFAVISDTHFGNQMGEGPMVKVPRALRNLMSKSPRIDAIFVCGDLTDWGRAGQYDQFMSVFNDTTIIPKSVKTYYMMGNHDNFSENAVENYKKLGQPLHQFIDIKGYPFITVSLNGGGSNDYNEESLAFLAEKLKEAATRYPGKPIFVFTHVPPANTVYGSCREEGSWGTEKLNKVLNAYPQAIVFAGHSHFPLSDPRSINQRYFTSINDGSVTYSEVENGIVSEGIHPEAYDNVTEGLIITVDKQSNVNLQRWDTYNNEEILPAWNIRAPHDGKNFAYANRTGGEAPRFTAGASVKVTDIQTESCRVSFPEAKDDEVVHRYLVEIVTSQGEVANSTSQFSGYFLNSKKPKSFTVNFLGIPSGSTLTARVTAIDSYGNTSEPIQSTSFQTPAYIPAKGSKCPKADLLDVHFSKNGKAHDASKQKNNILAGSIPPAVDKLNPYNYPAAGFNGSGSCFYRVDYDAQPAMKKAFTDGFTFETLYSPNSTNNLCMMSAQEGGGAGLEQASGGQLLFYAHVGGSYKTIRSSIKAIPGKYYHIIAIYDKQANRLKMYVNGMLAGETDAKGEFGFPNNVDARWIAIGGDAHAGNNTQFPLNGKVVIARMYSHPVCRDEVFRMSEAVKNKKF